MVNYDGDDDAIEFGGTVESVFANVDFCLQPGIITLGSILPVIITLGNPGILTLRKSGMIALKESVLITLKKNLKL